jgi:hypothetical protein
MGGNTVSNTPLYVVQHLSQILVYADTFIDYTSTFTTELSKFRDYIFLRINNMTEHEIKEVEKMDVERIANIIKKVFNYDDKNCAANVVAEELTLNYHYKCLTSKILEKRIKSITHLVKLVENVKKKENKFISDTDELEWLDSNYLFSWIKEKGLIDYLLGENIHEELLKRALPIFLLYAKKNSLNTSIYDQLWKNVTDRHESIAIQLQNIICELTPAINEKDREYLFDKVKTFPVDRYNNDYIIFLKTFTLNCLKMTRHSMDKNSDTYGLNMLWNLMQDKNDFEMVECAFNCLSDIFREHNFNESATRAYITLCFENIKFDTSVLQSIKLLKVIIMTVNTNLLKEIDNQFNIMEIIVKNFTHYIQSIQFNGIGDLMTTVLAGHYSHRVNLELRFEFIEFLYRFTENKKYKIELNGKQLSCLWDNLVINSRGENEKNLFYKFLINSNNDDSSDSFTERIAEYLFNEILTHNTKFDLQHLSFVGFRLFKKYFIYINERYDKIKYYRKISTNSHDIYGYNILWEILIETPNEIVKRECAKILANLCVNLSNYEEEIRTKIWTDFISKLIHYLQNSVEQKSESGVKGILLLIKLIIRILDSPGEISSQENLINYQNSSEYIFIHSDKNLKRPVKIGNNEKVIEVREKISYFFDVPINYVSILSNKRIIDLKDDVKIFKDLIDTRSVLKVYERGNPILDFKNNPSALIKENKFIFNTLFNLLQNPQSSYIEDAWELINLLPKSKEIEENIHKTGSSDIQDKIDWNKFLDYNSIYKMSYSLQIIKSFVNNIAWVFNFRKNGGIGHLIQLLMKFKVEHFSQNLGFQAFNDIIEIFYTLKEIYGNLNKITEIEEQSSELIYKLFENALLVMKASYQKDNDQRLKDLQHEWTKKRNREMIHRSYYVKKEELEQLEEIDEIHETIRIIWTNENKTISLITTFLYNFDSDVVVKCLMNQNDTVLKEILTFGLINPKNYMMKYILFSSIEQLIKFRSDEEQAQFNSFVFKTIFTKETLDLCISNNDSCEAFFKIGLLGTLSHYETLDTTDIDFKSITEYMIEFIESYKESSHLENVLIGFLSVLRELVLVNKDIHDYLINSRDMIDLLIHKCIFSKCQCNICFNIVNNIDNPIAKCNSAKSKNAAYRLISAISYNNLEYVTQIVKIIQEYHRYILLTLG